VIQLGSDTYARGDFMLVRPLVCRILNGRRMTSDERLGCTAESVSERAWPLAVFGISVAVRLASSIIAQCAVDPCRAALRLTFLGVEPYSGSIYEIDPSSD